MLQPMILWSIGTEQWVEKGALGGVTGGSNETAFPRRWSCVVNFEQKAVSQTLPIFVLVVRRNP